MSDPDRRSLEDLLHRFAFAIDERDWAALEACLDDRVSVRLDETVGGSDEDAGPRPAAERVEEARSFFGKLDATHHQLTVCRASVDGDRAELLTYFRAGHFKAHVIGGSTFDQVGHYVHDCVRRPDGWRIAGWRQTIRYTEGNAKLLAFGGEGLEDDG